MGKSGQRVAESILVFNSNIAIGINVFDHEFVGDAHVRRHDVRSLLVAVLFQRGDQQSKKNTDRAMLVLKP